MPRFAACTGGLLVFLVAPALASSRAQFGGYGYDENRYRGSKASSNRFASCVAETHYDCGVQIGASQAERINLALATEHGASIVAFVNNTGTGRVLYDHYLQLHARTFPHLVDEVNGTATGAGVPFKSLFALNLEFELAAKGNLSTRFGKGCSDYHLNDGFVENSGWGHNEDGSFADRDLFYFVSANISSEKQSASYFAFTYAGRLSGWAWGYNSFGVAITVNGLFVPKTTPLGLGINFIARDLLSSANTSDAVSRASRPNQDGGSHFNVGDIISRDQISIETGGGKTTVQQLKNGVYFHFNAYLHNDRHARAGDYTSSIYRMARASTLTLRPSRPQTIEGVLDVLGDDQGDARYCIYRCNTPLDPYVTYVTVLIDLVKARLSVYADKPSAKNATTNAWWSTCLKSGMPLQLPPFPY